MFEDIAMRRECAFIYEKGMIAQNLSKIFSSIKKMEWTGIVQLILQTCVPEKEILHRNCFNL